MPRAINPTHPRYWTAREVDTLITLIDDGHSYDAIAKRLKRSRDAVMVKVKRLRYRLLGSRAALTAREAQALLGLYCSKAVSRWIVAYGLKARNAGTSDRPLWRIQWLDLCEWLEVPEHWMCYDPAKVTERTLREHLTEIRVGHPRWLAVGEVAARYHVGVGTVAQWRDKGILPMVRYGNYWVREDELDGFVPPAQRSLAGIPKGQRRILDGKDGIRTEAAL